MHLSRRPNQSGSVLLILLVIAGIIGLTLTSYLTMISTQNTSTTRSLSWNSAIPVAEAGIEEALAHINHEASSTNWGTDGWMLQAGSYFKTHDFGTSKYIVAISNTVPPVIYATAYVQVPLQQKPVTRTIMVDTKREGMFSKGMVAKGNIDLSGNKIRTDSFDSSNPSYSTGGLYDSTKSKDNGDIATDSSVIDSLNIWNADIYGHASTGPGGNVKIGSNGTVGSKAWHDGGNTGIQPGWSSDDMNVYFPDVQAPFAGGYLTPAAGSVGGTNYNYVLSSGNYRLSEVELAGSDRIFVGGDAVLYVTGSVDMTGNSYILISTNASFKLYVGGYYTKLGGNGIMNSAGNATNFFYYGLPNNTSVALSGNAAFTGTLYAPNAALTLGGGGSTTYDFVGAAVANSITMNGHYNFHYDESLGKNGPIRSYVANSWVELPPSAVVAY